MTGGGETRRLGEEKYLVFGNKSIKRCLTSEAQSLCFGVFLPIRSDISVSFAVKNIIRILLLTCVIDDRSDRLHSSHGS